MPGYPLGEQRHCPVHLGTPRPQCRRSCPHHPGGAGQQPLGLPHAGLPLAGNPGEHDVEPRHGAHVVGPQAPLGHQHTGPGATAVRHDPTGIHQRGRAASPTTHEPTRADGRPPELACTSQEHRRRCGRRDIAELIADAPPEATESGVPAGFDRARQGQRDTRVRKAQPVRPQGCQAHPRQVVVVKSSRAEGHRRCGG